MQNTKTFSLEIEKMAQEKSISHMDAVLEYCKTKELEPESVTRLISKSLKDKIEANARSEAFNNVRTSRDYFGKIGITERKLIVKKRANASANSFNLGFEQTLGFALPLGLSTGGNTLTTILEEEF